MRRKRGGWKLVLLIALAVGAAFITPAQAQDVSSSIVPGDFASLKAALENPERNTVVSVPAGTYEVTSSLVITKDLTLQNQGGAVVFEHHMLNTDSSSLGAPLIDLQAGTLTFDGTSNDALVFDGRGGLGELDHRKLAIPNNAYGENNFVSDNGVFMTVQSNAHAVINHATFKNSANAGALTAPLLVRAKGFLTMNDGLITHNYLGHRETTANAEYFADPNIAPARSAGVALYGGSFTMNGGTLSDNMAYLGSGGVLGATGALYEGKMQRAKITITGGTIINNSATDWDINENEFGRSSHGGAINAGVNTDTTISGGSFEDNYAYGTGGAIYTDWGTTLTISGGSFKRNEADMTGGAVSAYDHFMVYDPESMENYAGELNVYKINDINAWYNTYKLGVSLNISGGTFDSNKSHVGGALYIACDNTQISGGTFTNNEAHRYGGALYLASQPYKLTIKNAVVSNNKATSSSDVFVDGYPPMLSMFHTGSGGGLWYCPSGTGSLFVSNGVAVFDNSAATEGDDITSMKKEKAEYKVSMANRLLGGGYVALFDDLMNNRATENTPEHAPIIDSTEDVMVKSNVDARVKKTANDLAKTVFKNNTALRGGAIATNGHVDFGEDNLTFNLDVTKQWDQSVVANKQTEVTAELYLVTHQKDATGADQEVLHYVDEQKLNQDNGYHATFKTLPLENFGATEYRVVEKDAGFEVNYSLVRPDPNSTTGEMLSEDTSTFNTRFLKNGDTVSVTMTNSALFAAHFEFVSADPSLTLPDEVMALLPADLQGLKMGADVSAPVLETTSISSPVGTWTFEGWTPATHTMGTEDVTFTGTWSFTQHTPPDSGSTEVPEEENSPTPGESEDGENPTDPVVLLEPARPETPKTPEMETSAAQPLPKTSEGILAGMAPTLAVLAAGTVGVAWRMRSRKR